MMGRRCISLPRAPAGWLIALNLLFTLSCPDPVKAHQAPEPVVAKKKQLVHHVKSGETLSGIARFYGVSLRALMTSNHLSRPVLLRAGQRLLIPEAGAPTAKVSKTSAPVRPAMPPAHFGFLPPEIDGRRPALLWPLDGPISSHFGRRRDGWHAGIDIRADLGTPILAAAGGVVVFSGWERSYGRVIRIRHDNEFVTVYSHNLRNFVEVGDEVYAGQVIGAVGRTGRATSSHLHFELWNNGRVYDPVALLPARSHRDVANEGAEPDDEGEERE
jgi:murein DD-endopeptidase MepM/ murein hydrolase activator NlpD